MAQIEKKHLQRVKVYARQRPFTRDEIELRRPCIVESLSAYEVSLKLGQTEKKYNFDHVFGIDATQDEVYEMVVHPLMDAVLSGYTCTAFSYGQTGTGKTYTMFGQDIAPNIDFATDASRGMVPRAAIHLFSELNKLGLIFTVKVSFFEIYNEEIWDLLVSDSVPLRIYDDPDNKGTNCIKGLSEVTVVNTNEVYQLLNVGINEKHTASTLLNRQSSRSHTIFTLIVTTREVISDGQEIIRTGKLNLIDLDSTENIEKSGATEMRAREAANINKSLLTLGKVIKALALKMQHIPYRESKLTRILQDSLGGKSKTSMIATFAPCIDTFDETISTLDYADIAQSIANYPVVNINKNQSNVLKDIQDELTKLRQELNAAKSKEGIYVNPDSYEEMLLKSKTTNESVENLLKEIAPLEEQIQIKQQHYDDLNRSFQRTNDNVKTVTEKFEKETRKQKQTEHITSYLKEKLTKLNEITSIFLNVCETATKHQDIYHKKYENQCISTIQNANIARIVWSTATDSLKEIQNSLQNFIMAQEGYMNDISTRACDIKEKDTINAQLNCLLFEIELKAENYNLTFDGIFGDNSYSQRKIHDQFINIYNNCYDERSQKLQELQIKVKNVEDSIFEKTAEVEAKSSICSNQVSKSLLEDEAHLTKRNSLLDNILATCYQRRNCLQEQLVHVKKQKEVHRRCRESLISRRKCMNEQIKSFPDVKRIIDEMLQMGNSIKPLLQIEDALVNFNRCLTPMTSLLTLMSNSIKIVGGSERIFRTESESCENKSQEYCREFVKSLKENLNYQGRELATSVRIWSETLGSVEKSLNRNTTEHTGHIESATAQILAAWATRDSDVTKFVQQTSENIENEKKKIVTKVHAGDTPMKPVYPKVVLDQHVPEEELCKCFRKHFCTPVDD